MLHGGKARRLAAVYTESWRPRFESIVNETLALRVFTPSFSNPSPAAPRFGSIQWKSRRPGRYPAYGHTQVVQKRTRVRIRTVVLVMSLGAQAVVEARPSSPPGEQTKQANNDSARRAEAPAEKAWRILHEGLPAGELRPTGQGGTRIRFARGQCGGGKGGGSRIARRKTECAVGGSHGARFDARGARRNLEEALGTANRALCWPR